MASRPREPRRWACAALGLVAAVACGPGAPRDTAQPTAPPSVTAPPSASRSTTPAPGTPSPTGRPYVLGVVGDWGVDRVVARRVVAAMTRFNGSRRLDAVVTTGDNAYNRGTPAESERSKRLIAPIRDAGTPIYPALGNHDVATGGGAPFMRAFGMSRRWYTVNAGPVQVVILDSNRVSDPGQLAFVKRVLAAPRPRPFRVVAFHHPGWSCSAHSPNEGVVERWLPLFGTRVDLVLSGHNHTYERFRAPNGVPYITTGGGGARLYASAGAACRGQGKVQYLKTFHHAVRMTATTTALRVEAVGVDGRAVDRITLSPR